MKPYLFTATDRNGKRASSAREAQSIEHLRAMLERDGYTDIEFLDSEHTAELRQQRNPELQPNSAANLRMEAELRSKGRSRLRMWRGSLRANWPYYLGSLALAGYGLWFGRPIAALTGILGFGALVSFTFSRVRNSDDYDGLLTAQAHGDWERASALIARLEKSSVVRNNEQLLHDLQFRKANLLARRGRLDDGLALIEPLRTHPRLANGMFQSRRASVFYAAGRIPEFVRGMQEAYEASNHAQTQVIDFAFVNARFGDCARARELLSGVRRENLTAVVRRVVDITEALCALRGGDLHAAEAKAAAALDTLKHDLNGAPHLAMNAIVAGYAAIVFARAGKKDAARQALAPLRAVADVCLDPGARRQIATLFPDA